MMAMVSDIDSASSWSCVTRMKVMPTSRCRFCSSICMSRRSLRSSAASGSSSSSTVGRLTSARARATRCCWPPDSSQVRRAPILRQAHQLQRLGDALVDLGLVELRPRLAQAIADIVRDVHVREERVVLEHHVDRPAIGRHADHRASADRNLALVRLLEAGDQAQAGGLAAAGGPEEGMERAARDLERDVVDRHHRAEALGDAAKLHVHRSAGRSRCGRRCFRLSQ